MSDSLPKIDDYKFNPDNYYAIDWKVAGGEKKGRLVIPPKNKEQTNIKEDLR